LFTVEILIYKRINNNPRQKCVPWWNIREVFCPSMDHRHKKAQKAQKKIFVHFVPFVAE